MLSSDKRCMSCCDFISLFKVHRFATARKWTTEKAPNRGDSSRPSWSDPTERVPFARPMPLSKFGNVMTKTVCFRLNDWVWWKDGFLISGSQTISAQSLEKFLRDFVGPPARQIQVCFQRQKETVTVTNCRWIIVGSDRGKGIPWAYATGPAWISTARRREHRGSRGQMLCVLLT